MKSLTNQFLLTLTLIILPVLSFGQDKTSLNEFRQLTNVGATLLVDNSSAVEGSPFYINGWENGKVIFKSGKESEVVPLVFNNTENRLFFKKPSGETTFEVNLSDIKGFIFTERNEVFKTGFSSEEFEITPTTPLRILYDGGTKLVSLHQTVKRSGNTQDPLTGKVTDQYFPFETLLIIREDGSFKKTRIRKRNMLRDLGTHKDELDDFLNETGNKVKTEQDAIELVKYFDSLN